MRLVGAPELDDPAAAAAPGHDAGAGRRRPRAGHPRHHAFGGGAAARAARQPDARPLAASCSSRPSASWRSWARGRSSAGSADWLARAAARAVKHKALAALLALLTAAPAAAQPKRDDSLQTEQRKLQQTQKQLREEQGASRGRARARDVAPGRARGDRPPSGGQARRGRAAGRAHQADAGRGPGIPERDLEARAPARRPDERARPPVACACTACTHRAGPFRSS